MNHFNADIVVSCEPITAELLADVQHLYADEPFKAALWAWQFKPRFGQIPLCVVARVHKKIIGFNGTMPVLLALDDGQVVPAIWSCDFIVDAAYRGQGVGGAIKNALFNVLPEPIMSLGISDSAYPLLLKKGGKSPVALPVFHRVNSAINVKSTLFRLYSLVRALPNYWAIKKAVRQYQVDELAHLPDSSVIEYLWALHMSSHAGVQVVRNHEYLSWRYAEFPKASTDIATEIRPASETYRFLSVSKKGASVSGLVVFRISSSAVLEVVDFIGDVESQDGIFAICHFLLRNFPHVAHVGWNTSAPKIIRTLTAFGFIRKSYSSRFIVFNDTPYAQWNIAAGDSDGDFLRIAKERFDSGVAVKATSIGESVNVKKTIGRLVWSDLLEHKFHLIETQQEFFDLRDQWQALQSQTNANPLFMAWGWQYSWWDTWGEKLGYQLAIVALYLNDELVGLVPLYQYRRGFLKQYQFIGNAWGLKQTIRSEYISPLFKIDTEKQLSKSFEMFFGRLGFNATLIVPDCTAAVFPGLHNIILRNDIGYRVSAQTDFEIYQRNLGSQTRLKAFGRRKQLQQQGSELYLDCEYADENKVDDFFLHLNSFHLLRWGKPCFNRDAVSFHKKILALHTGIVPALSSLVIGEKVSSLSYNLVAGAVFYNLQSGYVEQFDKKISLGTLHMGWELERCFVNSEIVTFDFLAGQGKVEDYKRHYRGEPVEFFTVKYFSSSLICWINTALIVGRQKVKFIANYLRR